jgi:hypothetical protein
LTVGSEWIGEAASGGRRGIALTHIWQEPGAPPQRPHIGAASFAEDLPAPSAPTAKTLSAFTVCFDPHSGQAGFVSEDIDLTSSSNRLLHF